MENVLRLETPRLVIRRLENRDREDFDRFRSMPEGFTHQSRQPRQIRDGNVFSLTKPVEPGVPDSWHALTVCLKDGTLIGNLWIHFLSDGQQAEIGYTLSPEHLGQGYATEGVGALLRYLFSDLGQHRVTVTIDPENARSIRLMERIGFRMEARFIQSRRIDREWVDDCVYAMLREEWERAGGGV